MDNRCRHVQAGGSTGGPRVDPEDPMPSDLRSGDTRPLRLCHLLHQPLQALLFIADGTHVTRGHVHGHPLQLHETGDPFPLQTPQLRNEQLTQMVRFGRSHDGVPGTLLGQTHLRGHPAPIEPRCLREHTQPGEFMRKVFVDQPAPTLRIACPSISPILHAASKEMQHTRIAHRDLSLDDRPPSPCQTRQGAETERIMSPYIRVPTASDHPSTPRGPTRQTPGSWQQVTHNHACLITRQFTQRDLRPYPYS